MPEYLPLLVFPQRRVVPPENVPGFPPKKPHLPERLGQAARLMVQMRGLQQSFALYQASIAGAVAGMEPETVLVMEIAGAVDDFKQAVDSAGLEWLGEWDVDDIDPTDDFYEFDSKGNRTEKLMKGRVFLSMTNEAGMRELLSLWQQWSEGHRLPHGKGKWADVFAQLLVIRRWGIEETLRETGMIDRWEEVIDPLVPDQRIAFQIELFYRRAAEKRQENEQVVAQMLHALGGRTLGPAIDIGEIAFHAVKAELPAESIRLLLAAIGRPEQEIDIQLVKYSGIMYFRATGQSLAISDQAAGEPAEFEEGASELAPVAALLDGAPLLLHDALRERLQFDDPFEIERLYQPGERKHGTSMASLIVHGDRSSEDAAPLTRRLHCVPVMQPDPDHRNRAEHMPDDVFFEDRIHIAVRRMIEGIGDTPPQAPQVKVVNLSICDPDRPFIHTPSPWARLLDWLSWKYRVLFCVSAGNFPYNIEMGISHAEFSALQDDAKLLATIKATAQSLSSRRLLSPAESINAITVGALHCDDSGDYMPRNRIDLMPNQSLFSPAMRLGHGFRKSVKPELLFPGGRQLYITPIADRATNYKISDDLTKPGQQVAWDSPIQGNLSNSVFTRGTSNAAALATRSAVRIYDMLDQLREQEHENLPESLMAVLIKALLVHGARQSDDAKSAITQALKDARNSRQFKEVSARYVGYGTADIDRVLSCTAQRATLVGCSEIRENEVHEYAFPLPIGLSSQRLWRRLVVTLAWFTPINPDHRNLREAKLEFEPGGAKWDETPLKLKREDGDHNQVLRGTVQHEVLEGASVIGAYQDGETLRIRVVCKKDATSRLDDVIPYALAVSLEVKEDVPIYEQVRAKIKPRVAAAMGS